MLSEIKVALRGLLKSPGFTVIAIATLALAIGANTSVFSSINALLVRPLPYQQPSKLVLIWERFAAQGLDRIPVSPPEYLDLENQFHGCTQIAAPTYEAFNLGSGDLPERISGAIVSPALFPLLGVEPIKGRTFAREEQGHALKLVGIGTAIGLVLAFLSTCALAALLYNVGAFDPATFAIVTVVLTTIAFLASYIRLCAPPELTR
jgi:hypothetical protein